MNTKTSSTKDIYGFDILKFVMAIMIVAIHSAHSFDKCEWHYIAYPIIETAVPLFFVLSSYFLFKKLRTVNWGGVKQFVRRICTFYIFWFIVNLPIVIKFKYTYFTDNVLLGIVKFVRDVFFSYTFSGSWFLSALVLSVLAIYWLKRLKVHDSVILLLAISVLCLFQMHDIIPKEYGAVYDWIAEYIRPEVTLTVVTGIPWVAMGYLLSHPYVDERLNLWKGAKTLLLAVPLFLALWAIGSLTFGSDTTVAIRPLLALSTLALFFVINIRKNSWCRMLREYSILMYMVHFDIIIVLRILKFDLDANQVLSFLIVLPLTLMVVTAIIFLRKYKYFRWLKYAS